MRWVDLAYARLAPRVRCFEGGWGDRALMAKGLDRRWRDEVPEPVLIHWGRARTQGNVRYQEGWFESPDPDLPLEAKRARVRWVTPRQSAPRSMAVVLASWGDAGFEERMRLFGTAADAGVGLMILEQPLYGHRQRVGQRGTRLVYASDFVLMGRAAVQEARGLLAWATERGIHEIGVAGYSMGAQMAGFVGSLIPWPIRVVPVACACSPAAVFFDGPLSRDLRFDALGPGAREGVRDVLESLTLLGLPPPRDPRGVRLVGLASDAICPPGDVSAIARHWGVHPRWIEESHVSAVVRRNPAIAQAVIDAFSP